MSVGEVPVFQDGTAALGLAGVSAGLVNWLDADNDLNPDLLLDGSRLFLNSGAPDFRFREVTEACGLKRAAGCSAVCFDFDNDGWTDIATTRGQLWRNDGTGKFADVAAQVEYRPHAKAFVLGCGDIDRDGFADLYVGMGEDWNDGDPKYYPHQLWRNEGGKRFVEIGEKAGINRSTYGRAVSFSDVDGDGWQDIFVGNYRLTANVLWRNGGNGKFRDVAPAYGVTGRYQPKRYLDPVTLQYHGPHFGHTIGACWLDSDNDGQVDLFTANLVHKYVGPTNSGAMGGYDIRGYVCDDSAIYRRMGSTFVDWRPRLKVPLMPIGGAPEFKGDELWAGCIPGDANNDGWMDVYVPQVYNLPYAKARLFLNHAGARFQDVAERAGINRIDTYAGAWADVDRDGWLDLATAGRPGKDQPGALCLYRNTGAATAKATGNWLRVRIAPSRGGKTLLGTAVTVNGGGLSLYQEVSAGSSTQGQQNEPVLHFGLGAETGEVLVSVRWPDGTFERVRPPPTRLLQPPAATKTARIGAGPAGNALAVAGQP